MEYEIAGIFVALLMWTLCWAFTTNRRHLRRESELGPLPPGPHPWPIVGNIPQLARDAYSHGPHQSLARLAREHGPVMTLHLGSMTTVVVSSSEAARVMFKSHDAVMAGRKIYESMKGGDVSNEGSLITAQYGPHWRMLRRLCTFEFFSSGALDANSHVRAKCVDKMVRFIRETSRTGGGGGGGGVASVDVGRFFFLMAFNLIGNLIFSKDLTDEKSERGASFFYHTGKTMEFAGRPNVADYFPVLRRLDPQGIRRKTQFHVKRAFEIAGEFMRERMRDVEDGCVDPKKRKDYLDVLLEYRGDGVEGPVSFSSTTMNTIVFEMFTAATDTTTSTLEWAVAELLHNPSTLKKVQSELRTIIGPEKKLEEQHLDKLPYLRAVVKETLRLHPPLPFLVPHMAMDSCEFLGFRIPKETQVLVNVWAIGRDPKTWKDPNEFKPERFLEPNNTTDYKGHHFEFIPFGSGRRMCPAVPLASRVLPMALGSVLHSFDWILPDGLEPEDMDMKERMGITLRKAVPLKAVPFPYEH